MASKNRKKIMLVCYGGGHVNMIVPLVKFLLSEKKIEVIVLGLTTAGKTLKKNDIPYIGFRDLLKYEDQDKALLYGQRLYADLEKNQILVDKEESVAYLGLSFLDLVNKHGLDGARELMSLHGRQSFFPVSLLDKLIKKKKVDLVLATNAPRAVRASIVAASKVGVKSICLVDTFGRRSMPWVSKKIFADKICVMSEFVKKEYVLAGRSPNDVVVTGNPAFDSYREHLFFETEVRSFRALLGWDRVKPIILWASQIEPEYHPNDRSIVGNRNLPREIERWLILIADKLDIYVIFRRHPNEIVTSPLVCNERVYISSEEDMPLLIEASKCVITMTSTVGIEALVMQKFLITVDKSVYTKDVPYSSCGLSVGVNSIEELEFSIKHILTQKQSSPSLNVPVSAARNVVSVIKNLLER